MLDIKVGLAVCILSALLAMLSLQLQPVLLLSQSAQDWGDIYFRNEILIG